MDSLPRSVLHGFALFVAAFGYIAWSCWPRTDRCTRCSKRFPRNSGSSLCIACYREYFLTPRTGALPPAGSLHATSWIPWLLYQAALLGLCLLGGWKTGTYLLGDSLNPPWSHLTVGVSVYLLLSTMVLILQPLHRQAFS